VTEEQKVLAAKDAEILDLTVRFRSLAIPPRHAFRRQLTCVPLYLQSRLRYAAADFQNLQRISEREKAAAKDFAISRFAKDILSTVDVLSMAIKSVPQELRQSPSSSSPTPPPSFTPSETTESSDVPSHPNPLLFELYKGVELTERQLLQTLAQHGITAYDPLGETFDPNKHEALFSVPVGPAGEKPGTIIDVQKVGFKIKGRTLRAPQVGMVQES
jgi:molecular chaperone GrpE